ncbi:MAG TPA: epimerase, partial [Dehalococcoidia bacterium]
RLPDIGGPEVQTLRVIARDWLNARGEHPVMVPLPAVGFMRGMAKGYNCCPESKFGKITWREWLKQRYGSSA